MNRIDDLAIKFHDDLEEFPASVGKVGQCKYPFASLDEPRKGFTIENRSIVTIRQALQKWLKQNNVTTMAFSVREVSDERGQGVRVRRDR